MITKKRSKYNSKKSEYNGIIFDSELEKTFYENFTRLNIDVNLERQITLELQPKFEKNGKKYPPIKYIADFKIGDIYIDIKGMKTVEFSLKEKMFNYKYKETLLCLCECPIKYRHLTEWGKYGFIEYDKLKEIRKNNKKGGK